MSLSERIRPNSEASPWVIDEVKKMEADKKLMQSKLDYIVEYCKPYLEYMWASAIVSSILGCDLYECKSHLESLEK